MRRSVIIGTGSYIPEQVVDNKAFRHHDFYEAEGTKMYKSIDSIIAKFSEITGINERRYANGEQKASDLAYYAAQEAITSASIDPETLDYIILAHNFGDVAPNSNRSTQVPSLASRVKAMLGIRNSDCIAYDLLFGCPGWIEGVIQADCFIRAGMAKRCLIIGAETLSRVIDQHDRDSMIYADGGGAMVIEGSDDETRGIICHKSRTFATDSNLLQMGPSYSSFENNQNNIYLKMNGRKVYEFALTNVPQLMKEVIEKAGHQLKDIKKVLVHQANDKMDKAILDRLFKLFNAGSAPDNLMPMTIGWLGNSSVATVPTLLDLVLRKKLPGHTIVDGDAVLMASVGAGMNVNAILYHF